MCDIFAIGCVFALSEVIRNRPVQQLVTEKEKKSLQKQVKIKQETMAGWEKAKREAMSLKKELDNAQQHRASAEERVCQLDAALKECMQQLHYVREDQERRIHGAVIKASEEFEKKQMASNETLAESIKKIALLEAENSRLHKALSSKEKVIEELGKYRTQVEADLNALLMRVDASEKAKASLSYEVRVLEKELDIRSEETEFNRRTTDITQKQHQESLKKIAKLESECQRLRLLVRRRLPGPAALTKMKNEAEMIGNDQAVTRRRRSNSHMINSGDMNTRINFLTEQLLMMEEQNRSLQNALNTKSSQSPFSRNTYTRSQTTMNPFFKKEPSLAALSDLGSDDKASCADSWASSALITELEHFKNEKQLGTPSTGYMDTPEMNLMDDFAEMEKLAIVSIDYPATSSHHSSDEGNEISGTSGIPSRGHSLPTVATEIVPTIHSTKSDTLISDKDIKSENTSADIFPAQLDDLLKMLSEYCRASKISPHEVLEDMKVALEHNSFSSSTFDQEASDRGHADDMSTTKKSDQKSENNVSVQICKILELLEGINTLPQENGAPASTGYIVRVFQWKTAELSEVLQQFLRICKELLNGKGNLEQFVRLVASSLDWIMNHCFSLQDVSSMKDAMRSRLEWDESRSESEFDSGSANHSTDSKTTNIQKEEANQLIVAPANTELSFIGFKNQHEKETAVQSIGNHGNRIEDWKMIEGHETKFMETNHGQRNACENISCQENIQETKRNSFEKLEETCNNQETQPKSKRSNISRDDGTPSEKQLRDDREITAASEKLAECQETILNLGKQLKALSSPRDAALFDTVIHTPPTPKKSVSKRLSLLDNMLAEDSNQIGAALITTGHIQNGNSNATVSSNAASDSWSRGDADTNANVSMAIVRRKKKEGRSFLKKLFLWQKKGDRKKKLFS